MDFDDTPEEAAFRAEARAFLEANAERAQSRGEVEGYRRGQDDTRRDRGARKACQAKKHAAGFACIAWPKEWGGRGGTPIQQVIYSQEEAKYDVLSGIFGIGLAMCDPDDLTWGTPEHRARFAPPALRGEEIWCQLFSEPAGGSDLAQLRTRAERDGDDWIINGQKIWTSGAQYCRLRHPGHPHRSERAEARGLTFFFLDMNPGGRDPADPADVRLLAFQRGVLHRRPHPRHQRLGAVGDGWKRLADHADERALTACARRPAPTSPNCSNWRARSSWRTARRSTTRRCRKSSRSGMSARRG